MKEIMIKDLSEEYLYPALGKVFEIHSRGFKIIDISHWDTADALHYQYILVRVGPMNLRHM